MLAIMPLVSQEARPQMCSPSSREAKKGGTVSNVGGKRDGERVPPLGEDVEAARLDLEALDAAVKPNGERREIVVEVVADALLVVGDRFDIDQRAREFEYVHKAPAGGGERTEKRRTRQVHAAFIPDSAPPAGENG